MSLDQQASDPAFRRRSVAKGPAEQVVIATDGNGAVARAIAQAGFDGEGYYPITPSSDVGEKVQQAIARGEADLSFVAATSELAALSVVAGMSLAGGRAVDVTSSNGLLLKAEEMAAVAGMGLPIVLNLATREVSAPLNIKNGHSDLMAALGWGWIILCAPDVQAAYDLNFVALRLAEAVRLPVMVAYDGFHTSHAVRRIKVFADDAIAQTYVGQPPHRDTCLDFSRPFTLGAYMNDDLINARVQQDEKMQKAALLLPRYLGEYEQLSGRRYGIFRTFGPDDADVTLVALNTISEAARVRVDDAAAGEAPYTSLRVVQPIVLRPFLEERLIEAIGTPKAVVVAERASQFGAGNYIANEVRAALHKSGSLTPVVDRRLGMGGITVREDDIDRLVAAGMDAGAGNEPSEDADLWRPGTILDANDLHSLRAQGIKPARAGYLQAWAGESGYHPKRTLDALTTEETTRNSDDGRVNLKEVGTMPCRVDKHVACPGCGIFTNLNAFLQGIDGHVVLVFNTGCGMVVTTGYPLSSFKVPYVHNLFHNGTSTATGIVEMLARFRADGRAPEDATVIVVTGDGGDDIGMDQLVGAALRNDPFIVLEYDNKGYMNTGGQMCYTGYLGQKYPNAALGRSARGKPHMHKDIIDILRGTNAPYLFSGAEVQPKDLIAKARKAQAAVRAGNFAFGKVLSACPLNWGIADHAGPEAIEAAVNACLHPLYEVENGITSISYDPDRKKKRIPVTQAFAKMGRMFSHLASEPFTDIAAQIQEEVDRRWEVLKVRAEHPQL